MNILIIGGSGHVSGAVARTALAGGHEVWVVTRGLRPLPPGVHALTADRKDDAAMTAAVTGAGVTWDLVVDCICYDLPAICQDIALFRDRAAQFVLVSTDFVYHPAHRRFPQPEEATHYEETHDYGRNKRACELALQESGMAWTVVRPCHIYGPTSELGCLPLHGRDPQLIEKLRAGQPLELVGGGYFLQQPILANDLAATIVSIAGNRNAHNQIFNTAGPDIIESREYYRIVAKVLGVELKVVEVPVDQTLASRPELAPFLAHRIYDLQKLKDAGLRVPSTPIAEGLRLHVEGLLARRATNP